MSGSFWHDVYYGDLQSLWSLLVVPLAFLAWRAAAPTDPRRAAVPAAARFVAGLTLVFAFETMLDPIATGPFCRLPGVAGTPWATLVPFLFVLLGDLRVLLLVAGVARPERTLAGSLRWALGVSLLVPITTGLLFSATRFALPDVHGQVLWMIYEAGFLALCITLSRVWTPRAGLDAATTNYVRAILGYGAAYYALWLVADLLIVGAGLDLGWAIRIVPNQLYYAFWAPFAWARFFSAQPRD
ncbi:MAG: hypothetical protein R3F16_23815 [Myxococcota bacterium]